MSNPLQTTGWKLGRTALVTANDTAPSLVNVSEPANMIATEGWRGARFRVTGITTNHACTMTLYSIDTDSHGTASPTTWFATTMGVATWTIGDGTSKGVAGGLISETDFYADTLAWVVNASFTPLLNYGNGAVFTYSPTSEGVAELFISDLGNGQYLLPVLGGISSESFNYIYQLDV